ncbi:MAG: LysR family transcriptional regulator [Hyphomicrobiales bacterium]|nr:MAG: LysR family transcriptional regulator [Hyphomicrobiales bacterium]
MVVPRRFLPSINALLAFEGVARLGSVTQVAEQLALTQGAVSRQIQNLERQLGVALFVRDKKRLSLTQAGADYAEQIRDALNQIAKASLMLKANPSGGSLNLAILPTFGMRWLAPRLGEFAELYPQITVNLTTRLKPFDFTDEKLDAAIHFGDTDWPGVEYLELMTETVAPVCAPAFKRDRALRRPEDLLTQPLLHLNTRPNAWEHWFEANQVTPPALTGMLFDQFGTMAQAAIHGLGAALLPEFLIARDLEEGRLVHAVGAPIKSVGAYYLVWPMGRAQYVPLARFRDWLSTAIAA